MASAMDQLNDLNGMFRGAMQPFYDLSAGRLAIAQMQEGRRYREGQYNQRRQDARGDEEYLFNVGKRRQSESARATLRQLGKSAEEIAALSDDEALFLSGELAQQHRTSTEASTRLAEQRRHEAKAARGTLKQLGVDASSMDDDEAIFKAGFESQKAAERARREVAAEITAPQLSQMAAALSANGINVAGMEPDQVRDAFNELEAQRSVSIRGAQEAVASDLSNRIGEIQMNIGRLNQGFDRAAALRELLAGQKTKTGVTIGANTPAADVEAHWNAMSVKQRAPFEMQLNASEDEFNKTAPALHRTLTTELYRANNNLTELALRNIVPMRRNPPAGEQGGAPAGSGGGQQEKLEDPLKFLQRTRLDKQGASGGKTASLAPADDDYDREVGLALPPPRGSALKDIGVLLGFDTDWQRNPIDPQRTMELTRMFMSRGMDRQGAFKRAMWTVDYDAAQQRRKDAARRLDQSLAGPPGRPYANPPAADHFFPSDENAFQAQ